MRKTFCVLTAIAAGLSAAAQAGDHDDKRFDFGRYKEQLTRAHAMQLFGVNGPLAASSKRSIDAATAEANPRALVSVASSLRVRVVSADKALGANIDMIEMWPNDVAPTHLIVCNEQGTTEPSVQRIGLADGKVETILTGMSSCDPVHRTPWGTVVVGEEAGNSGWMLEIIDPIKTTGVQFDRASGTLSGPFAANVATRPALGRLSYEGVAVYPNGVMYYGDENRPSKGTGGGAYYKFVPSKPWTGGGAIANLADSPLTSGTVYGLRLGKRSGNTDYGQGTNTGRGTWIELANASTPNVDLRAAAAANKLTGYYRPEDIAIDKGALVKGLVRFCGNNTGNEVDDGNWGETLCITDGTLDESLANTSVPEAQFLVVGYGDFAMMDNIAYQPGRGNWIIHEDGDGPEVGRNNDIFACLDDGADADTLSDGCIRVVTLNDLNAESTGGVFDATGTRFFFSVQHNVTGHGVVLEVTGWR